MCVYRERSRIRNSQGNVAVRIDDYDDITLIWLLCIIRGIELAKDSPKQGTSREDMTSGERARVYVKRRGTVIRRGSRDEGRSW